MVDTYSCGKVSLQEEIGYGAFGKVFRAILANKNVAVKIMHGGSKSASQEIGRMSKLNHENVISLLGTVPSDQHRSYCGCSVKNSPWIIMEYMPNGSLSNYLSNHPEGIPAWGMVNIAYEVAFGMDYLHRCANLVHRDLAARNILLSNDEFSVKIGDFGLSTGYDYSETYYEDKRGQALAIRWMPPENMPVNGKAGRFSRKGDVWSYGVVLYELWTRGGVPFLDWDDDKVIRVVTNGKTPANHYKIQARKWVLDIMKECFQFKKENRPNFKQIYERIWEEEYEEDDDDDEYEDEDSAEEDEDTGDEDDAEDYDYYYYPDDYEEEGM